MKDLIIFGLLSVCLVGVHCFPSVDKIEQACAKELGLNPKSNTISSNDKIYGCFVACVLKAEGAMKNGVINVHHKRLLQYPRTNQCANLKGKDDCDTAKKFNFCIYNFHEEEDFVQVFLKSSSFS